MRALNAHTAITRQCIMRIIHTSCSALRRSLFVWEKAQKVRGESGFIRLPEHRIDAHIRASDGGLAYLAKAKLPVERLIAWVLVVEVTRLALRLGLPEHGPHELAAESVALARWINPQRPDIPVRSRRRLFVRIVTCTGGAQEAPQAGQAEL